MDELQSENYTWFEQENLTLNQYDNATAIEDGLSNTLSDYQIAELVWCLVCTIPNILLLYIFIRNHLYNVNFYFVLMNWCLSDLLYIMTMLYFLAVPDKYIDFAVMEILYYVNTLIPTMGLLFVTLFMFESFLKSEKFCKYFIFADWFVLIVYTVAVIILCSQGFYFVDYLLYVIGALKVLSVAILVVKILMFFIKQRDDENAGLRLIMAGIYILLNFYVWFFELILVLENLDINFLLFILFASFADAYLNLALLLYFNPSIKCYFYQICRTYDENIIVDYPEKNERSQGNVTV